MGTVLKWLPGAFQVADMLTKEEAEAMDKHRAVVIEQSDQLADEQKMLQMREEAKKQRQERGKARAEKARQESEQAKRIYPEVKCDDAEQME